MTRAYKQLNLDVRDAKQVLRELNYILSLCSAEHLPKLAKAMASDYKIPKKVMLKTMSRYARLHHSN